MPLDLVQIPTKAARNKILRLPLMPWGVLGAKASVERRISLEKRPELSLGTAHKCSCASDPFFPCPTHPHRHLEMKAIPHVQS